MRILEPAYLQLVGLALPDERDFYLRTGNYLRWFSHPKLGLPRRGFRLLRRQSVVPQTNWGKRRDRREAALTSLRRQGNQWQDDASGLIMTGGFSVSQSQYRLSGVTTLEFLRPNRFDALAPAVAVRALVRGPATIQVNAAAYLSSPGPNASVVLDSVEGPLSALVARRDSAWELTLSGGLIDQVTLQFSGRVELVKLEWIDAQLTSDNEVVREWEPLRTFFLPIVGDDRSYPRRSLSTVQAAVDEQLTTLAPKAMSPAATHRWPPNPLNGPHPMIQVFKNKTEEVGGLITELLARELSENVPQDQIRLDGNDLGADGMPEAGGMPILDLMLAGALDPMMAALLGLMWRDIEPAVIGRPLSEHQVDYLLEADYPYVNLLANLPLDLPILGLSPSTRRVPNLDLSEAPGSGFFTAIALLPNVGLSIPAVVEPPTEFNATFTPIAGRRPIPGEVSLSWTMVDSADVRFPGRIASAIRRNDDVEDISLEPTNPDTLQPFLRLKNEAAGHFVDRQLRTEGNIIYRIHAMDLFGRWSDPARTDTEVLDLVPPSPPSGLSGVLSGNLRPDGIYETLTLTFDWTLTHAVRDPDTTLFRVHLRAGSHGANAVLAQPDKSGNLAASGTTHDLSIANVTKSQLADGRQQYEVVLPNVPVTTLNHVSTLSAIVLARDNDGNTSRPTRAAVIRAVEAVVLEQPSVPEIVFTTWADAEGIAVGRLTWPALPAGARLQIVTASSARLLALAGEPENSLDGLNLEDQAQRLRALAVQHPPAFSPDHPRPYDHQTTHHDVKMRAADRSLRVALLRPTGPTGMLTPWPSDPKFFAVIATRSVRGNRQLNLVAHASDTSVTITATTTGRELRLYRTKSDAAAGNIRAMTPLPPIVIPQATTELSTLDETVEVGQWYAYCGIAVGQNGASTPVSGPVWVYVPQ